MLDDKEIAALKEKHGVEELHRFTAGGFTVHVKAPGRGEWNKFKSSINDEKKKVAAGEVLFRTCCVHPGAEEVDAMLSKRPGLAERFASELVELAGMTEEIEKKVL